MKICALVLILRNKNNIEIISTDPIYSISILCKINPKNPGCGGGNGGGKGGKNGGGNGGKGGNNQPNGGNGNGGKWYILSHFFAIKDTMYKIV